MFKKYGPFGLPKGNSNINIFKATLLGQSVDGVFFTKILTHKGTAVSPQVVQGTNRRTRFYIKQEGVYFINFTIWSDADETYYIAKNTDAVPTAGTDNVIDIVNALADTAISSTPTVYLKAGDYLHITSTHNGTLNGYSYLSIIKMA